MIVFRGRIFAAVCIHQLNQIIKMAFVENDYFPAFTFWKSRDCINLALEERSFLTVVMLVVYRSETLTKINTSSFVDQIYNYCAK